jgi:hypothetical protein
VLPSARRLNSWLALLGTGLTVVYAIGVSVRAGAHTYLGLDSILALIVFALGVAGLLVLPHRAPGAAPPAGRAHRGWLSGRGVRGARPPRSLHSQEPE